MSELSPKPVRSDEEQHRLRFEEGSNAQQRSAEEQRRLMEEYDQARYEEAFPVDEDAEKAYNEAMEAREYEKNALIEGRILERQDNGEGKEVLVRPEANRMYMMAQEIAELRANGGEPKIITNKENKLQELLEKYSDEAHANRDLRVRNAEINERSTVKGAEIRLKEELEAEEELEKRLEEADFIINSTDEAWVNERASTSTSEEELKTPKDAERSEAEKKFVKDPGEARLLAEVERISRAIKSDPEGAEKAGLYDEVRKLSEEVDKAVAAAKKAEEELKTPKSVEPDDEELKTPKDADEEEIKTPKDAKSDDEIKTPKDAASADDEEIKTPKDAAHEEGDDSEPEKRGLLRRAWNRIAAFGYKTGGASPAGVVRYGLERFRDSENKGKIAAFVGAAAIIAVAILGREQGWFDGHHGGGGGNQDPNAHGDQGVGDAAGQNDRHPNGFPDTSPTETVPQIPDGGNYAHPWNWMKAAMENGSIKAPEGMSPEQALHHYGELAADANHKVEWYNLPNGLEAVRIDGHEDTAYISLVVSEVVNNVAQKAQKAV